MLIHGLRTYVLTIVIDTLYNPFIQYVHGFNMHGLCPGQNIVGKLQII